MTMAERRNGPHRGRLVATLLVTLSVLTGCAVGSPRVAPDPDQSAHAASSARAHPTSPYATGQASPDHHASPHADNQASPHATHQASPDHASPPTNQETPHASASTSGFGETLGDSASFVEAISQIVGRPLQPAEESLVANGLAALVAMSANPATRDDTTLVMENIGNFLNNLEQMFGVTFTETQRQILVRTLVTLVAQPPASPSPNAS